MLGKNLFNHYLNNWRHWKAWKSLPASHRAITGFFPSEPYFKYPPNYNFEGKKVLNFGCGLSVYKFSNVANVDVVTGDYVLVRDPSQSLAQFGQDFDMILANHVMEHVPDWFNTLAEMAEILKPGGRLEIYVPPISSDSAFSFRDHINRIGMRSFDGVGPTASAGVNLLSAWEYKQFTALKKLKMISHSVRPCMKWWMLMAWPSLMKFFSEHLRNTISEEQFIFVKLP